MPLLKIRDVSGQARFLVSANSLNELKAKGKHHFFFINLKTTCDLYLLNKMSKKQAIQAIKCFNFSFGFGFCRACKTVATWCSRKYCYCALKIHHLLMMKMSSVLCQSTLA